MAKKPNIILFMSDDVGWGDLGCYGGGENRGAPTPNLDRLAAEGLQFMSFYGQPSCTPGRAAALTGRLPIRSGMTTVAFPGDGGGLPAPEWTLASVLKKAFYNTCHIGKWHLGEADSAMPTAHGFDEMYNTTLYHLNAYTYTDKAFNPDFPFDDEATMKMWGNVIGALDGKAGEKPTEVEKLDSANIPFIDEKSTNHAIDYIESHANDEEPFFLYLNTAKLHQPNLPHPDFEGASMGKSKFLDSLVELDHRVGTVIDKVRELGIAEDTLVVWTTDNGAWQDVYPDCGYTPYRGTKGTDYEGGSRVPAIAWWPGTIEAGRRNSEIVGSLDLMATFASLADVELPTEDREGEPTIFDSFDQSGLLKGENGSTRDHWLYMTETEMIPGAVRVGKWKAIWNVRDQWRGPSSYTAIVPELFDLWQDPQERYDIFMTSFAEKTWQAPQMAARLLSVLPSYQKYPNRPLQSAGISYAMFDVEDAQVQQQIQKMLHGLTSSA
ncbi:arylsulfatase [Microbacterium oxydans]|uniref:arylsulfatase n=1 Tax=Microbacterium sp. B19(2022) TaxID=2914045 RepID=UPI00142F8A64|nr:arylsulfatase [Microbacterium sp. B19(2022)]NJI60434.1 arylsulfatase [Microbacterium sp. B19(2022)]